MVMQKLRDFAEQYKAIPMFIGGALTMGIGMVRGKEMLAEYLVAPKGPVIEFVADKFLVTSAAANQRFTVFAHRRKYRDDCNLQSFQVWAIDRFNYRHDMLESAGSEIGNITDSDGETFKFTVRFPYPQQVTPGLARLQASVAYICPERIHSYRYPDKIFFLVKPGLEENTLNGFGKRD